MRVVACLVYVGIVAGCGGSTPAEQKPAPPVQAAAPDAAVDAAPPDADVPDDVASAPAWIFRYNAPGRLETWTLRFRGSGALVVVESSKGTTRYVGTATDGADLALAVASGPNKLALACKRKQLAVGAKCGDKVTKKVDVLDCYHPDFAAPMSFAVEPGLEFVTEDKCSGYRRLDK